jgi:hypothetical protein
MRCAHYPAGPDWLPEIKHWRMPPHHLAGRNDVYGLWLDRRPGSPTKEYFMHKPKFITIAIALMAATPVAA